MEKCIWCREVGAPSQEHVIPEALGCPKEFILSGGTVCRACNNGLGHLDQAVIDDFDLLTYMSGVPRKRGRPPEVRNRGNLIGTKGPGGNEISINMGSRPIQAHDGTSLGTFGKSDRNIRASFEEDGQIGEVSFPILIGQSPKFVRGVIKIAFSTLAYFLGGDVALSDQFNPVRAFVREGKGRRPVLLVLSSECGYRNQAWPPYVSESGEYAVVFRLAALEFCADLSPKVALFPMLKNEANETYGESGWTTLPIDP